MKNEYELDNDAENKERRRHAKKKKTKKRDLRSHGLTCPHCKKKILEHGTASTYAKGCRCDLCKEAVKLYYREYRKKKAKGAE